uniref:Uncharacterized protein n=1 Tax=Panagrolaimus sp. ES5 TaxID=591445 RepID=A0AC34FFM6_9BILA
MRKWVKEKLLKVSIIRRPPQSPTSPSVVITPNFREYRGSSIQNGDNLPLSKQPSLVPSESKHSSNTKTVLKRRSSIVRERWASKLEFLLAVIGYAVDLGNIWRFPSVCFKHGGGAFLIPYIIMLCISGLPMFYMELALGQFHKCGYYRTLFKGIGYGICFVCTFIACFYNSVIAQALYFMIASIAWDVPWRHCNNTWNTPQCRESLTNLSADNNNSVHRTPHRSSGFDDLGAIKPSLAFCMFIVFLIVYFALWKGPRSSGKVVWVTATAPYVVLTILLIRAVTLPGASVGIYYYLTPNFEKLLDPNVWTAAATQIFFSLGPGFGVLLALSSYNDFNNNLYRDAIVTSLINCFTSFFSGFVIFATLGYMSQLTNTPVSEVVGESESMLIFVVYPQAIATMSYPSFWAFIFFLMLLTLGIDSTFSGIEALITGFCDEYPRILQRKREIFVAVIIFMYYLGSLPAVTYGGSFVVPFLDEYGVSLSVLFIVMCEMIAVCWFYGIKRFSEDIRLMLGFYPGLYWQVCWMFCPIVIGVIFGLAVYNTNFAPISLPNYTFPQWSVTLGWTFRMLSISCVPLYAAYMIITTPGTFLRRLKIAITPIQRHPSMVSTCPSLNITAPIEDRIPVTQYRSSNSSEYRQHSNSNVAHL